MNSMQTALKLLSEFNMNLSKIDKLNSNSPHAMPVSPWGQRNPPMKEI